MKNKGWKIFGVVVFILAIIVLIVTLSVDGYVKSGIEEKGSDLLQTAVHVEDVDISIFNGSGIIKGFVVENPEGFSDEPALTFGHADIKVQLSSLFSDVIVVSEVIIKDPEIFFEQQETLVNLKTLNDNFNLSTEEPEKALIIDYLVIENTLIKVSTSIDRERAGEATLDRFELEGIGREGSNTVKESIRQILEPLLERAIAEAIKEGAIDQLENRVKDLFNRQ